MKFEPISCDHAARLIDKRPWEVSRSAELLAEAQLAAMETYACDMSVVGVDIYNVEIEAYGCDVLDSGGTGVPIAGDPICEEVDDLLELNFDPEKDGRMPMILEAAKIIRERNPSAKISIPMSGPFTVACHLIGMEDMICELFTDLEPTVEGLMHLAENQLKYARYAVEQGFNIALFESSVTPPLLSPELFNKGVVPALAKVIDGIRTFRDAEVQLIIGGNTSPIIDGIQSLSPSYYICPARTDQVEFMSQVRIQPAQIVRINMNPAVFLPGRQKVALEEAQRVLDLAKDFPFTTIGSLMPFDADIEVVRSVGDFLK